LELKSMTGQYTNAVITVDDCTFKHSLNPSPLP
jgi:hypothetical protein